MEEQHHHQHPLRHDRQRTRPPARCTTRGARRGARRVPTLHIRGRGARRSDCGQPPRRAGRNRPRDPRRSVRSYRHRRDRLLTERVHRGRIRGADRCPLRSDPQRSGGSRRRDRATGRTSDEIRRHLDPRRSPQSHVRQLHQPGGQGEAPERRKTADPPH